jgi:hypothetical protein
MANCPQCGSEHIQLKRETNVNWGRAVAGWALFGVVGGAVGSVTGKDRNVNACLDCGTTWKAADLYKTVQTVNGLIGVKIDLSLEDNRSFLNEFIKIFSPKLEQIGAIYKKYEELSSDSKINEKSAAVAGGSIGCGGSILLVIAISGASASVGGLASLALLLPILGMLIGSMADRSNGFNVEEERKKIKKQGELEILEAEAKLKAEVWELANEYFELEDYSYSANALDSTESEEFLIEEEMEDIPDYCPRCEEQLPPPLQSSGRIICRNCGWRY